MTTIDLPRRRSLRRLAGLAAAACISAHAAEVSADDARAVRAVIEAQLAAFAADDARRAFDYAAPAIREQFASADDFMAMVRAGYAPVVRPAAVAFLAPRRRAAEVLQELLLTDADGRPWRALYHLERQSDGAWRITGCELAAGQGRSV